MVVHVIEKGIIYQRAPLLPPGIICHLVTGRSMRAMHPLSWPISSIVRTRCRGVVSPISCRYGHHHSRVPRILPLLIRDIFMTLLMRHCSVMWSGSHFRSHTLVNLMMGKLLLGKQHHMMCGIGILVRY